MSPSSPNTQSIISLALSCTPVESSLTSARYSSITMSTILHSLFLCFCAVGAAVGQEEKSVPLAVIVSTAQIHRNGGYYCLPYVMFLRNVSIHADPGILVGTPLTSFRKALEILRKHVNKEYHKNADTAVDSFLSVMSVRQKAVSIQFSYIAIKQVVNIRKKLRSIIETFSLCGRQNIPIRRHRESYRC